MICPYDDSGCSMIDTSDMTKPDCNDCPHKDKISVCIASIPERESLLQMTVESLRGQCDNIYVALNDYDHIPEFLKGYHTIILSNDKGDAAKHYWSGFLKGFVLTCDDDLVYPSGYVKRMVAAVKKYKCACTLHGRNYPETNGDTERITNFQRDFIGYPCLGTVLLDVKVDIGGDGVMCYHTDFLKVKYSDFLQKNMSQLYFSKLCKEQGVPIMCLSHVEGYLKYLYPADTIWDQSNREGFVKQTALLKEFLK
jgi:hypothetical protein